MLLDNSCLYPIYLNILILMYIKYKSKLSRGHDFKHFFLAKPKLSHFIQNQWVQSSWYNIKNMGARVR